MMDAERKIEQLSARCQELEITCRLWIAANEAKDDRIQELVAECNQLRQRVARLSRQVGRKQKVATPSQISFAR
jgi:hypothetical protein